MIERELRLNPHRLFSPNPNVRGIAAELYDSVKDLPIISPHGHTDPLWFANNTRFKNATELFLVPDHYVLRMLYSQGIPLEQLGVECDADKSAVSPRESWRVFAQNYHLFTGTPSRIWLDHIFAETFGLKLKLGPETADMYFDSIGEDLQNDEFRPRSILERFNIEFIATTEGALDSLEHHAKLVAEGLSEQITSTFRPDDVLDPDQPGFTGNVERLGLLTGENTAEWTGYLKALRNRREHFIAHGVKATDHGHPSPATRDLSAPTCQHLLDLCLRGEASENEKEDFRGQMLTEMARMSLEDGLVMQLHLGSHRNHNSWLYQRFGPDKGADIPRPVNYTENLKPLLNAVGNEAGLTLILFTLDESTYARELAPLAGHYPCLLLGPPWWFHDSPEGMMRFRRRVTETAGFYNTAGFNDDTRALFSIPARHDLARRMDCRYLAELVAEHRIDLEDAHEVAVDLSSTLVRKAYNVPARDKSDQAAKARAS